MKRVFLLITLVAAAAGFAPADTAVNFVDPGFVSSGQTFTVDVEADNSPGIAGFSFDVSYDPTILTAIDAEGLGDFAGLSGNLGISDGTISGVFGLTSGDQIDMGSGIPLAVLTFQALAPGDVTLSLANLVVISDPDSFATEDNPTSNTLDIAVASTPEPASWCLAAGGALFLAVVAWRRGREIGACV